MAKNKRKAIEKVVRKAYGDFEYSNPFILNKKKLLWWKNCKVKKWCEPLYLVTFYGPTYYRKSFFRVC